MLGAQLIHARFDVVFSRVTIYSVILRLQCILSRLWNFSYILLLCAYCKAKLMRVAYQRFQIYVFSR